MSPAGRPALPAALRREVLVEAGHRCAIPQCRQTPVQIAHITPWATAREHRFDNLIALCANCHGRFDGGEIDRVAMRQYKANLGVLRSRYSDLELRLLKLYANEQLLVALPTPSYVLVMHLIDDGMIRREDPPGHVPSRFDAFEAYALTTAGIEMVRRLAHAEALDA